MHLEHKSFFLPFVWALLYKFEKDFKIFEGNMLKALNVYKC